MRLLLLPRDAEKSGEGVGLWERANSNMIGPCNLLTVTSGETFQLCDPRGPHLDNQGNNVPLAGLFVRNTDNACRIPGAWNHWQTRLSDFHLVLRCDPCHTETAGLLWGQWIRRYSPE